MTIFRRASALLVLAATVLWANAACAAFSLIQGWTSGTGTGSTATTTLSSAPAVGHLVVVLVQPNAAQSSITCADGNSNNYNATPSTPLSNGTVAKSVGIFYWLAAGTPSAAITCTMGTSGQTTITAAEFAGNVSSSVLDTDATGFSTTNGTSITSPSITPAGPNELFVSTLRLNPGGSITPGGSWTGINSGANTRGEYQITTGSSAQAVNYTIGSAEWVVIEAAFKAANVSPFILAPAVIP